nr:hypothetical protein [uncultured Brumimicrobium sp.]
MIKKIKSLINEFRDKHDKTQNQLAEIEWANIYHDSINNKPEIKSLSLNVGRWAGNYSFFYLLSRILDDFEPKKILEFGLGESSKFIGAHISAGYINSRHKIIEHDDEWQSHFLSRCQLPDSSEIIKLNLTEALIENHKVISYENVEKVYDEDVELFIVDGPFGSPRFSRFDIIALVKLFIKDKKFIIIIDDYQRVGEKDTCRKLLTVLKEKNIDAQHTVFSGNKKQMLISSNHYRFLHSI